MKTIELASELAPELRELLELALQENVILRMSNGREFVLAQVDDFDREIELVRQNQELMTLLAKRSQESERYRLANVREVLEQE